MGFLLGVLLCWLHIDKGTKPRKHLENEGRFCALFCGLGPGQNIAVASFCSKALVDVCQRTETLPEPRVMDCSDYRIGPCRCCRDAYVAGVVESLEAAGNDGEKEEDDDDDNDMTI